MNTVSDDIDILLTQISYYLIGLNMTHTQIFHWSKLLPLLLTHLPALLIYLPALIPTLAVSGFTQPELEPTTSRTGSQWALFLIQPAYPLPIKLDKRFTPYLHCSRGERQRNLDIEVNSLSMQQEDDPSLQYQMASLKFIGWLSEMEENAKKARCPC